MFVRVLWFAIITFTAVAGPFWLAVLLGVAYLACYQGLELMLIAVVVDAYFGYGSTAVPYVTFATAGALAVVILLRPHLTLYT